MQRVLLPRKQFQFLAALPNFGLITFVLQALFRTSCLAQPPSPQSAVSCATRHLVATAVLTTILPQRCRKLLEIGQLSMPEGARQGLEAPGRDGTLVLSVGAAQPAEASGLWGGGWASPV